MITARISEYRSNLSSYHTRVLQDHEPLRVTGSSRGDLILVPAEDFERLQESISVLKDRATMNSLLQSRTDFPISDAQAPEIKDVFNDVMETED
jgi:antitoxin YefM